MMIKCEEVRFDDTQRTRFRPLSGAETVMPTFYQKIIVLHHQTIVTSSLNHPHIKLFHGRIVGSLNTDGDHLACFSGVDNRIYP